MATAPLNVTVVVAPTLRGAMEGRKQVQLGVPPTADVGDVLETLLKLYPKLAQHMATDRRPVSSTMTVFMAEQGLHDLARRRSGLKEGARLYLSAALPRPKQTRG